MEYCKCNQIEERKKNGGFEFEFFKASHIENDGQEKADLHEIRQKHEKTRRAVFHIYHF